MVCLFLRECPPVVHVRTPRAPQGEVLETHEVLADSEVLGRIERYDPTTTQMGAYCWAASSRGTRSWWFSKSGAISRVVEAGSVSVAQRLMADQSTEIG